MSTQEYEEVQNRIKAKFASIRLADCTVGDLCLILEVMRGNPSLERMLWIESAMKWHVKVEDKVPIHHVKSEGLLKSLTLEEKTERAVPANMERPR